MDTCGRDADNVLGKNQDWISIDEVQLMTGISDALPKLMTRMRAQRSDGTPRRSKLSMLTSPGDNPELDEIRRHVTAIQANPHSTYNSTASSPHDIRSHCNQRCHQPKSDFEKTTRNAGPG